MKSEESQNRSPCGGTGGGSGVGEGLLFSCNPNTHAEGQQGTDEVVADIVEPVGTVNETAFQGNGADGQSCQQPVATPAVNHQYI